MEEDHDDARGNDKPDGKEPRREENLFNRAIIREFIVNQLAIGKPSEQDARQESTRRQHQLGGEEIAEVHQRHSKHLQV